jgi:hypothetical protein
VERFSYLLVEVLVDEVELLVSTLRPLADFVYRGLVETAVPELQTRQHKVVVAEVPVGIVGMVETVAVVQQVP